MAKLIFYTPLFISFLVTFIAVPYWIHRARMAQLVGKDMHKLDRRRVAEIGGVPVLIGFLVGMFFYIGVMTFYLKMPAENYLSFAILTTVLISAMIGLIDDILGWKIGLRQWQKPLLTVLAALPMVVFNAGYSIVGLPYFGTVELSYVYPFIIVLFGIVGATNGFNMIGGYNGLEAGMGAIIVGTLGILSYLSGQALLAMISFCLFFAIIAFLFYNWYPAQVFPGNTFTYFVGSLIACIAILGNMEKLALLLFMPYFIELLLKSRGFMQRESFANILPNGSLTLPHGKWYGIEHVIISILARIKGKAKEEDVVVSLLLLELILAVIAVLIYYFRVSIF